jgi:hypothetical protein
MVRRLWGSRLIGTAMVTRGQAYRPAHRPTRSSPLRAAQACDLEPEPGDLVGRLVQELLDGVDASS